MLKIVSKSYKFNLKNLVIMWIGGLFRGTISFALIISVSVRHKRLLEMTVLGITIFTMIVYGFLLPLIIKFLKPEEAIVPMQSVLESLADGDYRMSYFGAGRINLYKSMTSMPLLKKRNWFHKKWRVLDNKYLKPCLINKESLEELKRLKEEMNSPTTYEDEGVQKERVKFSKLYEE